MGEGDRARRDGGRRRHVRRLRAGAGRLDTVRAQEAVPMSRRRLHADPWRAVCPNGHSSWEPSGDGYLCQQCGSFGELHDAAVVGRPAAPMHR